MGFSTRSGLLVTLAVLVGFAGSDPLPGRAGQNNKKPIPRATAVADTLKSDLDNFVLRVYVLPAKEKPPSSLKLVTGKKPKDDVIAITKEGAAALVDHLRDAGVFDELIPPFAKIVVPGWYLHLGINDRQPKFYIWSLGATPADATAHPAVKVLQKSLKGDAKAGLDKLLGDK